MSFGGGRTWNGVMLKHLLVWCLFFPYRKWNSFLHFPPAFNILRLSPRTFTINLIDGFFFCNQNVSTIKTRRLLDIRTEKRERTIWKQKREQKNYAENEKWKEKRFYWIEDTNRKHKIHFQQTHANLIGHVKCVKFLSMYFKFDFISYSLSCSFLISYP